MKQAKWTIETRRGDYFFFILFQKVTFYFIARFFSAILNSIQCLVERCDSQRPNV